MFRIFGVLCGNLPYSCKTPPNSKIIVLTTVNIGVPFAITMDWIDNLLCRFSNSGFSNQSFCLQKVNMWLFKLSFSHYWLRKKMNKVLYIILISLFSLTIISCAKKSSDDSKTTTDDTTTSDDDTTTTTTTTTTTDTVTGVIYQAISVKKKPKKTSIKYTSLTAKPTTTNLNFDNAQFGNVKFQ